MATRPPTPYAESPALAAARFMLEVAAWVAIYFAWGWVALVLAVAAISLLSVPGDKHMVAIRVPGKLRVLLEIGLMVAGVAAAHARWAVPSASALLLVYAITFVASRRRMIWLWQH